MKASKNLTIRLGNIHDKAKLAELVRMMIRDENKDNIAQSFVEDFFSLKEYTVFVSEVEHFGICGFGALKFPAFEGADEVAELLFLGVEERYRRQYVGSDLVRFIEYHAKDNGIRKLYIKTNSNNSLAVCFWIMLGYKFEARMLKFGSRSDDDYYLAKELN